MLSRIRNSREPITTSQHRSIDFILSIFKEDRDRIGELVSKIPYAETGGNLFGLWTNQGNAVVLVATGPGKNCKRTTASFYQDIPYMKQVGDLLTKKYPLCHIGEWHSHHQMQLFEPSYGDCNTVQRNYPIGSQGFVLMIANILNDGRVKLSPYKFTGQRSPYKIGKIEVMDVENPFMKAGLISNAIENGKEKRISKQQLSGSEIIKGCQGIRDSSYTGIEHSDLDKRAKRGDYSSQRSHIRSRSRSPIKKNGRLSPPDEEMSETRKPRRQQETTTFETTALGYGPYDKPRQKPSSRNKPSDQQNFPATQWYDRETDTLKRILEYVTSLADDPTTVSMRRDTTTLNITITFTHHDYGWSIEFPSDFPRGNAKLKNQYNSCSVRGLGNIDNFEKALKFTLQEQCATCKNRIYSKGASESPSQLERLQGSRRVVTPAGPWYDREAETLKRILEYVTSLADDPTTVSMRRDTTTLNMTMTFTHHDYGWSIEFPFDFPRGTAKLKNQYSSCSVRGLANIDNFEEALESTLQEQCAMCKHKVSSKSSGRREIPNGYQRSETPVGQWYDIQPNTSKRIIDFVTSLADGKRTPKISREISTKNITMEFRHHEHKWAVEFPSNFPTGNVMLKRTVKGTTASHTRSYAYSYTNAYPLSYNVKACGDVKRFEEDLGSALRENCEKCKINYRYAAQNNRYASCTYK